MMGASRLMAAAPDAWTEVQYLRDVASVDTEDVRRWIMKAKRCLHKLVVRKMVVW